MRTLGIHSSGFKFFVTEKAIPSAENIDTNEVEVKEDCLVVFIAVEKPDEKDPLLVAEKLYRDLLKRLEHLHVTTVVLYPYVHLTQEPSNATAALTVMRRVEELVTPKVEKVLRAPFGWYKGYDMHCKGHPLSEWSGRFGPEKEEGLTLTQVKEEKAPRKFQKFFVADLQGKLFEVDENTFGACPVFSREESVYKLLHRFVSNEFGAGVASDEVPKHVVTMRKHELVDYCDVSEKGHYKWYPKGLLMQKLILDYAALLAKEWGASEMKNPIVIRGDNNVVGQLMGEFHERDYKVDGGRGLCYLRYASDPLGFPFMQKVRFTYKQSPLKVYEEATCFRNEKEGEVSGLKRVRNFMMTDMHAACATVEEARHEFDSLCLRFGRLMNDLIASGRWVLGWEGTVDFFEENKAFLLDIGVRLGVPAFFKLMPEMTHYYAIKNEFQSITHDGSNIQVSTVQWDVRDGERFNIGYIDDQGKKHPCPVILHASSFGSIERTLCTILENIAIDADGGIPAAFPLWLSPAQIRLVTVNDSLLEFAESLCGALTSLQVRTEIDDRKETVSRKIRAGEEDWVPYLVVLGEKEKASGKLAVRRRKDAAKYECTAEELAQEIRGLVSEMPYRPIPLDRHLSKRPTFVG